MMTLSSYLHFCLSLRYESASTADPISSVAGRYEDLQTVRFQSQDRGGVGQAIFPILRFPGPAAEHDAGMTQYDTIAYL